MKKNILAFIYILLFVILIYFAQTCIISDNTLFGVKPNLILISVIIVSLWYGLYAGTIYSFIIGFITDILYYSNIGMFTVAYTISGIIIGLLYHYNQRHSRISIIYATFISVTVFEMVECIYYIALTSHIFNLFYLLKQILISSILNIVITYIFYELLLKFTESIDSKIRKDSAK